MAGLGSEGAYGVGAVQALLRQRFLDQLAAEDRARKATLEDRAFSLQSRQLDQTDQSRRDQLAETARAHDLAAQAQQATQAQHIADTLPPQTFIPETDPAVNLVERGGFGSLLQKQEPTLPMGKDFVGPMPNGETPQEAQVGRVRGRLKLASAKQQQDESTRQDRLTDNAEQQKRDIETGRHNRAMEARALTAGEPLVQVMGPNGVPIYMPRSQAVGQPAAQAPRAVTGAERQTLAYFNRMLEAERNARRVEDQLKDRDVAASTYAPAWLENWLKSPEGQQYTQAQRMFTEARLRKESGAAIPENEFANDRRMNFRVAGDQPGSISQKRKSRLETIRGTGNAAGRALQEYYGPETTLDTLLSEFGDKAAAGSLVPMTAPDGRSLMVPAEKVAELEARGATRR